MNDDLKVLSWHDLYCKVVQLRDVADDRMRRIQSLQAELKGAQDSLAKLEARPTVTLFEAGKRYRTRSGWIAGPIKPRESKLWPFEADGIAVTWSESGRVWSHRETGDDLLPGAVEPAPQWTPPVSLPDGEYTWTGGTFMKEHINLNLGGSNVFVPVYRDWTDPPNVGRWQVTDGKATYLGAD